ncbi:hypothetical protein D3C73_1202900 [compost metagenome]
MAGDIGDDLHPQVRRRATPYHDQVRIKLQPCLVAHLHVVTQGKRQPLQYCAVQMSLVVEQRQPYIGPRCLGIPDGAALAHQVGQEQQAVCTGGCLGSVLLHQLVHLGAG